MCRKGIVHTLGFQIIRLEIRKMAHCQSIGPPLAVCYGGRSITGASEGNCQTTTLANHHAPVLALLIEQPRSNMRAVFSPAKERYAGTFAKWSWCRGKVKGK